MPGNVVPNPENMVPGLPVSPVSVASRAVSKVSSGDSQIYLFHLSYQILGS